MKQELIQKNNDNLKIKNNEIRICIHCGNVKIDSYEFGISCEDCGILLWRA
ncbi:hypothetical protein [Candidatus Nitrosopumilus sp. SW]|uniref:hypothetical protein n=1 Tax=Candidatus Nitrosopumilus sp. SW TaxID=2508726 RepID=UPI0016397252|nr:hypothetical protein [Candidatus Nitrosopumilus sp. SW]